MNSSSSKTNVGGLVATALGMVLCGALLGGTTNAINGTISPVYFRNVMRWEEVEQIWRAIVAQGVFEGLLYGVFFALVFTIVVGVSTKARFRFTTVLRYLTVIFVAAYLTWAVGGLLAMGLAAWSPEFYRETFLKVPEDFGEMIRYAWVGGSIWGAIFGGLLSVVIGSITFAANHGAKREKPQAGAARPD